MEGDQPKRLQLAATGPGEVTAGQIATSGDIEVMNPGLVLCHLANPIVRGSRRGRESGSFTCGTIRPREGAIMSPQDYEVRIRPLA